MVGGERGVVGGEVRRGDALLGRVCGHGVGEAGDGEGLGGRQRCMRGQVRGGQRERARVSFVRLVLVRMTVGRR